MLHYLELHSLSACPPPRTYQCQQREFREKIELGDKPNHMLVSADRKPNFSRKNQAIFTTLFLINGISVLAKDNTLKCGKKNKRLIAATDPQYRKKILKLVF